MEDRQIIFALVAVTIVAGAVYAFLWSRRLSATIRDFAESRGLVHHVRDDEGIEARVNECVALEERKLSRSFSQVGDIITLIHGKLFRGIELLDLNPYGRAEYVNRTRVAVMFPLRSEAVGIFSVSPSFGIHQRYPETPSRVEQVRSMLTQARVAAPPCLLSLTLMRGHVVAYLEPGLAGNVSRKHLDYLVELANRLAGR